jgi:glycosyltransferase involved in cell wall biosynthesis
MLTHNAPVYVRKAVSSVESTRTENIELVVLDNASEPETRDLVRLLAEQGKIDRLKLLEYNSLFAEGNNIAASEARSDATHFLLMNSDVEVRHPGWLDNLVSRHKRGITAYGVAVDPLRVDGYALLIDADLYRSHQLDEGYQWWWSVTKLQATLLNEGYSVQCISEHEEYLHHFGGKSGSGFKSAKGMSASRREVSKWFNRKRPIVLDDPTIGSTSVLVKVRKLLARVNAKMKQDVSR